ncbi:MAG: hypothetical protein IT369_15155 [Candidatus Latescibacteria bacterium]|nr:hypothetical protein [Candidatus Latescibacterota bacterium]
MDETPFLELARQILPLPTAPFHEHLVMAAVEAFASTRPALRLRRDRVGNLLLLYTHAKAARRPMLIAQAHLDHPGLGFPQPLAPGEYFFEKLGGVDPAQVLGHGVRLYDQRGSARQRGWRGRVGAAHTEGGVEGLVVSVDPKARLGPGWFGMWDLPPLRRRGHLLYGRACDDLAGVVAGLAFLDALCRQEAPVRAGLLLTRAEEVGFAGLLEAAHQGSLDGQAIYLNLECSSARAGPAIGGGPIVRVGDRANLFDPGLSSGIALVAGELAQAEPGFRFQRKLMDAGSCEASVFCSAGLRAGALAIPLGNYHNKGDGALAPEFIHLSDGVGLVRLLCRLALEPGGLARAVARAAAQVAQSMEARRRHFRTRLRQTTNRHLEGEGS